MLVLNDLNFEYADIKQCNIYVYLCHVLDLIEYSDEHTYIQLYIQGLICSTTHKKEVSFYY
jgi:hypothetical protein